jgi:hypothetical protein
VRCRNDLVGVDIFSKHEGFAFDVFWFGSHG